MPNSDSGDSRPRTLPVLFLGVLTVALDIALVATTLPTIRAAFDVDERNAAWILGVFVLFTLVGLPVMTALSDRYGRRGIYLLDFVLFVTGGLVVITSSGFGQLLLGRSIQGLGASGIFPVASAVIGDTVDPAKRGRSLGVLGSVYGLAFMVGPILGGVLVQYGWRWPFVANIVLGLVVLLVSARTITDRTRKSTGVVDWAGILVLAALLGSLAFGMNRLDTSDIAGSILSEQTLPFLALSLLLLPVFVWIERSVERSGRRPVLRMALFAKRQIVLVSLFASVAGIVEAAFVFMTDFTGEALGFEARQASFMLLPLVAAVSIASPIAGRLLDRVGSKTIISSGLTLMAVGMGVLAWISPTASSFVIGSVAIGFGLACLLGSALSYILLAESEVEERAVAQGINTIFISVGQLLGSALIGAVAASAVSTAVGYQNAFGWIAVISLLMLVVSFLLKGRVVERLDLSS